ncbi:MAG TPA: AraC family transcriptional regulator [Vicinamibacterales bacterium]|jgi:AraC-like DNA-binding protein
MAPDTDRVVYRSETVTIGAFRCPTDHPSFRDSGPIQNDCFVFPRTAVVIRHYGGTPFIADPTIVTLYNRRQAYERRALSPDGDRCDWFAIAPAVIREAIGQHDPHAADRERPIRFTHAAVDSPTYLAQRRLFVQAASGQDVDALHIDESVVGLLDAVLDRAYARSVRGPGQPSSTSAAELASATKSWLLARIAEPLTLVRIADAIGCSMFHLCRAFRRATGITVHGYRDQVRLRLALERIEQGERDLTRLALDLGYSSHSHFTAAFRHAFAMPPSVVRRTLTGAVPVR